MRLEEICQLELADVRKEDGVWVFDINRANGKHVKNPSSVRTVPIHSELIRMGLIKHYLQLHAQGKTRLFPRLGQAAGGKYGTNFTKWFGYYRKAIGLYEPKLDFHSFRHTTATLLRWADVPKPTIARILGHTETGETGNYGAALQIGQLKAALEQMETGLDLSHLHQPLAEEQS
jgi:integrase